MRWRLSARTHALLDDAIATLHARDRTEIERPVRHCGDCDRRHPDAFIWRGKMRNWHELF